MIPTAFPSAFWMPIVTQPGFENRGVTYADNMTGINWSTIPVTIVEMGFMTNESDDLKMSDPDFQDTMASGNR